MRINLSKFIETEPSVIVTSDELELILAYRKCSKRDRVEIKQECVESAVHADMCYRNDLARAHYAEGMEK